MIRELWRRAVALVNGLPSDPGSRAVDSLLAAGRGAARPCIPPPPLSNPRAEFRAGARPWNYSRPGQVEKELREQLEYMLDVHGEEALCRRLAEAAARRASEPKH